MTTAKCYKCGKQINSSHYSNDLVGHLYHDKCYDELAEILNKIKVDKDSELSYTCEVCGSSFETSCALSKHQHFFCTGNWRNYGQKQQYR